MSEYTGENIKVLEGLEAVRTRPGMYIGDTGEEGLHHMIWEIVDNSVDEALAGHGKEIILTLHKDHSFSVQDFGRGIPVDIHPTEGISTATVILTILHAGGKFDSESYKTSGGLHGVGASVVNALSEKLTVDICRNGKLYHQDFSRGTPLAELQETTQNCRKTGTKIWFKPDPLIFKETLEFQEEPIINRIKSIVFLNKGLKVFFINEISGDKKEFYSENGLIDYINELVPSNNQIIQPVEIHGSEEGVELDFAFVYETGFSKHILSYTNNVITPEGGTHEIGTMNAFTRAFIEKMKEKSIKDSSKISSEDIKEGMTGIISIRISEPEFRGQTKGKLNNPEARTATYKIVKDFMEKWIEENPKIFKNLVKKFQTARKARDAAKRSRELIQKEAGNSIGTLPGKLADCQTKDRSITELFLVEGDSAGGSSKSGRDRVYQAILPLKGKILNTEKSTLAHVLANDEIKALISAIGTGFGKDYDYSKLRYNKVIIMADADVDGGHIQFLNLLFLNKFYPELIEKGHVYVAVPPLYRAKKTNGKESFYLKDEKERKRKFPTPESEEGWTISRFKGLGEMDPEQLWETTMNPDTRTLIKVEYDPSFDLSANDIFQLLGGDNVKFRRWFLMKYASRADLDI